MRLITRVLKLTLFTGFFLVAKPHKVGHQLIVTLKSPVSVSLKKNTPPYVAFEEVLGSYYTKKSEYDVLDQELQESSVKNLDTKSEGTHLLPSQELEGRHVQLATMTIKKQVESIQLPNQREVVRDHTNDYDSRKVVQAAKVFGAPEENDFSDLPQSLQTRIQLAQERSRVLNQDWSVPSSQDRIREVIANELQKQNQGSQIIIAGAAATSSNTTAGSGASSQQKAIETTPPVANEIQVVGKFEVMGIGVTNEHHIELRRIEQGIVKEAGKVIVNDGFYSINVASLSGELVGRVVHNSGRLEGEKRVRLIQATLVKQGVAYVGPNLLIGTSSGSDIASLATPFTTSKNDIGKKTTTSILYGSKSIETKAKAKAEFQDLHTGSSTILKAAHPNYLPTLSLISVGNSYQTPLFSEGTLSGLRALLNDQMGVFISQEQPLIWGRVMFDGHPMSGVKIKTAQNYGGQAVYLNEFMLPDKNLTTTSDSGYFVIPVEQEGFYSILAEKEDRAFAFANTLAESGSVAYVQVEDSIKKLPMIMRSYDAFSGQPVPSQVSLQSSDMIYEMAEGEEVVQVSVVARHALAQLRGQPEYADATYIYDESKGYAHFPMVKKAWFQQLLNDNRINVNPSSGTVIGFSPDEDFEVYVPSVGENPLEIIYFNNRGEVLAQRDSGVAGGGFIILNLPESVQEVSVFLSRSQRLISKVTPIFPREMVAHLFTLN